MNSRSDSTLANADAPPTAASFPTDDTRHDETRHDETPGEASQNVRSPRNGALWLLLWLVAFYSVFSLGAWSQKRSSKPPIVGPFASHSKTADAKIVVHVAGAVQRPGVYTLNNNARVHEALHLAGGALPQASTDALNLADWAQDGARIEVPFKAKTLRASSIAAAPKATAEIASEAATAATSGATEATVAEAATTLDESSAESQNDATQSAAAQGEIATPTPVSAQSSTRLPREIATKAEKPRRAKPKAQSKTIAGLPRALTPDGKLSDNASPQYLAAHPLDLNKITREQLEALPGVGPSLAQKILDYRAQNSGFKSVEELDNVSGIGEKKLADLKPLLYVVSAPSATSQTPATSP